MNRWIVIGGVVVALVTLLVFQQRRLDRLEDALKRQAAAAPAVAPAAEGGGAAPAFAAGGEGVGNRAPQVKFVPVPVPVAVPSAAGAAAPPGARAAAGAVPAAVVPINPAFANRAPLAERLAQTPAKPVMADTSAPIRDFVVHNNIDQGQWDALVKANKDWVDTLVKVKQSGVTSAPGPMDQLSKRHDNEINKILGDPTVVESYNQMQGKVTTPKVSVQWGGKTYDGARIE